MVAQWRLLLAALLLLAAARLRDLEGDHNLQVQPLPDKAGEHAVGHAQMERAHIHPSSVGTQVWTVARTQWD